MSTSQEIMEETEDHTQEDETEAQQLREEEDEEEFELDREAEADKEDEDNDEENPAGESQTAAESESSRKKRKKDTNVRRPGELILPFSRVQRVIKADKDIPMIARDAIFLIGLATESFIAELAVAAHRVAAKEKRTTVQHKDIATVVRKADEFMFLEDILPYTTSPSVPEKKPKRPKSAPEAAKGSVKHSELNLDKFIVSSKEKEAEEDNGTDVVMNEDGTMYAVNETNHH
ncbi:DNA-directed DNA polymerase epsilon, subunit C [Leucoagaricus gongylophorus]